MIEQMDFNKFFDILNERFEYAGATAILLKTGNAKVMRKGTLDAIISKNNIFC